MMTVNECATLCGLSRQTIWRYVKRGMLRATKTGKKIMIEEADLNSFLGGCEMNSHIESELISIAQKSDDEIVRWVKETAIKLNPMLILDENKIKESDILDEFSDAYHAYPGTKLSIKKECATFIKAVGGLAAAKKTVGKLLDAIAKEKAHKEALAKAGRFVPEWKHFKTWLNNRCWEQQLQPITHNTHNTHAKKINEYRESLSFISSLVNR